MSRLGWVALILIVLVGSALLSMLRIGGSTASKSPASRPVAETSVAETSGDAAHPGLPVLAIPVVGYDRAALKDTWGDPHEDGRPLHHGADLKAPEGTPVIAAAAGTIEKLFPSSKGGTALYERSSDGRWQYYYAHLSGYAPGIHEGQKVKTGDPLGYVGDSGDAPPGVYQLHFGMSFMQPGDHWWQGEPVNPYPMLAGETVGG